MRAKEFLTAPTNDTAISLSRLGKFHKGEDTLGKYVPERLTHQFALHPDKWEHTFHSLTLKDPRKLRFYGPKKISVSPGTLVGDMAIANKFYRAESAEAAAQYAQEYKDSLRPYPVDVSKYRMPELLIPGAKGVAEGTLNEFDYNTHVKMLNTHMKKLGYSYIGHGTDAHVFAKEQGSVIKVLIPKSGDISTAKNPFLAFLNYCEKNANNPHLPKFIEITKEPIQLGSEKFDQVVMERLQEVDPKYEDLLVSITDSIEEGKPLDPSYQPYTKFYQTLKSVMLTGRKLGFENDIITFQSVNIMQRGNTLVIVDPWTGTGKQSVAEGAENEDLNEADAIKLTPPDTKVTDFIKAVYTKYPHTFQNNHVMPMGGEGDDQQFAMFELTPSLSRRGAVEIKWIQAWPHRKGVGGRAMQELQAMAKDAGIALTLFPWDKGQVSQSKLTKFYRSQGFKPTVKGGKAMQWTPELAEGAAEGSQANPVFDIIFKAKKPNGDAFVKKFKIQAADKYIASDIIKDRLGKVYNKLSYPTFIFGDTGPKPIAPDHIANLAKGLREQDGTGKLYHVAATSNVPKIQHKGILPLQTSNWIQAGTGERYGGGYIFAFDHINDAVRWAAKWDWDKNQTMGSKKISIIAFTDDLANWQEDDADPIAHAGSSGRWFKKQGRVKPEQITGVNTVTKDLIKQAMHRPAESVILERATSVLFHYTSIDRALTIVKSGQFELSSVVGNKGEEDYAPKGHSYFLSLTRTSHGDYHNYVGTGAVLFKMNGDWFNRRYTVKPIDYWERSWLQSPGRTREAEDRVFSKEPTIPDSAITEIHLLLKVQDEFRSPRARELMIAAKQRGLPIYLYTDDKAWRLLDKRRAKNVADAGAVLRGSRRVNTYSWRKPTDYVKPWLELIEKNKEEHLSDRAQKLLKNIIYYGRDYEDNNMGVDLSNARKPDAGDRASAVELIGYMRNNGYGNNTVKLKNDLVAKWKPIQSAALPEHKKSAIDALIAKQTQGVVEKQSSTPTMGINVRSDGDIDYASLIIDGRKKYESRRTDSLRPYVGKTVGIVRTGAGPAVAIGQVTIGEPIVVDAKKFNSLRKQHLVPQGSEFDIDVDGTKYLYPMINPIRWDNEKLIKHKGIVSRKIETQGVAEGSLTELVNQKQFGAGFEETRKYGPYILKATPGYMPYIPGKKSIVSNFFRIEVLKGKIVVGWVNFEDIDGNLEALDLQVDAKHRRKGIATAIYNFAKDLGNTIKPSSKQTAMGKQFWSNKQGVAEGTKLVADGSIINVYHNGPHIGNIFVSNTKDTPYKAYSKHWDMSRLFKSKKAAADWLAQTHQTAIKEEQTGMAEEAPPGARAERMVKHIKKNYAKDGKLTPKERSIAYATAWKAHNRSVTENFADGRNPQDKGDSQRHGIPKGATMAELEKAAKASGRKGQLARWQLNMRRGRARARKK